MYRKGMLKVGTPSWEDEVSIHLPHSCEEWIIGLEEECDLLIKYLQEAKKKLPPKQIKK